MSTIQTDNPVEADKKAAMLTSLVIENFRDFDRFKIKDLGRVNLLVGSNNSGKTTVLEAINLLMATNTWEASWTTLARRGENLDMERNPRSPRWPFPELDIRHLFRGHEIRPGASFKLSGLTDSGPVELTAKIEDDAKTPTTRLKHRDTESPDDFPSGLVMTLSRTHDAKDGDQPRKIEINRRGGISLESVQRRYRGVPDDETLPVSFVNATSLTADGASESFGRIVLTPEEDMVVDAMRMIEPDIVRIAAALDGTTSSHRFPRRGGILVLLKDVKDRVPIGSMGDGIWYLLGLALGLVRSKNGILLVDEIDTGLHYTVMEKMWRFLFAASKKYNVQVFATTHSRDCYQSLASICREDVTRGSEVTINRIERDRDEAVSYTEREILAAAEHDIEVR